MPSPTTPLSMRSASSALLSWAATQHNQPSSIPPTIPTASRAQVRVHPGHAETLSWLRVQRHAQKLFFRSRSPAVEVAALGFVHVATGPIFTEEAHLALAAMLSPLHPAQRFYGATRFDDSPASRRDPEWRPYAGYTFVLPAVELMRDAEGAFFLAANFYPPAGMAVLSAVLQGIVAAPRPAYTMDPAAMIPRATHVADLTQFGAWDASMTAILKDLATDQYDKIVLARRKRFQFHRFCTPTPIHVLTALDEQNKRSAGGTARRLPGAKCAVYPCKHTSGAHENHQSDGTSFQSAGTDSSEPMHSHRSTYLFCLQLDHDKAFLGCTPERLFRLEDRNILTEALAGTVRRGTDGNEGEVLSELLSLKNLEEHRFVVDYIRTALANCGVQAETNGPHVRRLPRLMHLATNIRGQFPPRPKSAHSGADPDGSISQHVRPSESNVYRLLRTMHPTPAVCGMPRERTITELAKLEDFDRGFFAGPLGWFSRDAGEFCVAIRSALVHGSNVTAFAGSGIVLASESKSEWDETELKLSAFTDLFQEGNHKRLTSPDSFFSEFVPGNGSLDSSLQTAGIASCIQPVHEEPRYDSGEDSAALLSDSTSTHGISTARISRLPSRAASANSMTSLLTISSSYLSPRLPGYFDPVHLTSAPNLNTLWGCCCVEELCRNGVNTFFVSPGSRSAPLAVGVVRSRYAKLHVTHDERGAGFLAVGYARATGRAAAVITSSGTAAANLLPAVVESSMDSLPMIVLTADRPPELLDVGANQAIYQTGIFGTYTRWSKDVPCPSEDIPLRSLLSDVDYAVHMSGSGCADGMSRSGVVGGGPVHMNMMFREKLAPDHQAWDRKCIASVGVKWKRSLSPMAQYEAALGHSVAIRKIEGFENSASLSKNGDVIGIIAELAEEKKAGVIILGGGHGSVRTEDEGLALYEIAEFLGFPVISDVCGGLRFDKPRDGGLVQYADQILESQTATQLLVPDAVLQFGERITSKRILRMISTASSFASRDGDFVHVLVSNSAKRCDPSFTVTNRVHSNISQVLDSLALSPKALHENTGVQILHSALPKRIDAKKMRNKLMMLVEISDKVGYVLQEMMTSGEKEELTEPWCARVISEAIARPSGLFIGNSMPIRDFDAFCSGVTDGIKIKVAANRGASGIDGIVSSGIGFGIGLGLDVTIVLGDMSMMHDLNALHLLRADESCISVDVTIVVVNNGGGGIFSVLPIAKHRDVFSPVFDTPHSVQFRKACEMFGLEYVAVRNVDELRRVIGCKGRGHRLVEAFVPNDHARNAALHQRLGAAVSQQVSTFFAANT